jgi:hypothetical protein
MEQQTIINEQAPNVLTPVNEFLAIIHKRYNSSPNSLASAGYREVLKMAEEFIKAESAFMSAAFTAGYEKAFEDLKNHNSSEPQDETEKAADK